MSDKSEKPKRGRRAREVPSELILQYVGGRLANGQTLKDACKDRLHVLEFDVESKTYRRVQWMKGVYLERAFREAEKDALPDWLRSDFRGQNLDFTGAIGVGFPQLPWPMGQRKKGRPKKIRTRAK